MNGQIRKEKFLTNQKRRIVMNWLSSLAVTVVAVVVTITLTQSIPKATFNQVEVYGHDIFYSVVVEDPNSKIISGTLHLTISNQLETRRIPLILGEQNGTVPLLQGAKEYVLSITCNYGYGEGVLTSQSIRTESTYGGRIIGWQPYFPQEPTPMSYEETAFSQQETDQIAIQMVYSDPYQELEAVWLSYVYYQKGEYPEGDTPPLDALYTDYSLVSSPDDCIVGGLWDGSIRFYTTLWGRTTENEEVVLDTFIFTTPRKIYASLYPSYIGPTSLHLSLYMEGESDVDLEVILKQGDKTLQTKTFYPADFLEMYSSIEVLFTGLKTGETYQVILMAHYLEEGVLTSQTLLEEDVTLPPPYTLTLQPLPGEGVMQFEVNLEDPNQVVSDLYYYVYQIVDGQEMYITGAEFVLMENSPHVYQGEIQVAWDNNLAYSITIYGTITTTNGDVYTWIEIIHLNY
ncbi:MAG: hypothetical protein PHY42_03065 [Bacilli bacterium]|nr:hypothetical protein [Bacilli bacterium]